MALHDTHFSSCTVQNNLYNFRKFQKLYRDGSYLSKRFFDGLNGIQDRNFKRLKKFDPVQNIKIMLSFDGSTYMGKYGRDTAVQSRKTLSELLVVRQKI